MSEQPCCTCSWISTVKDHILNDVTEYHIKHLELIEGIISRQAQNSFTVRGWSLTLSVGIFTFLLSQDASKQVPPVAYLIVVLPTIVFWLLDAYYLRQERLFRCLYDDVRRQLAEREHKRPKPALFDMVTTQ